MPRRSANESTHPPPKAEETQQQCPVQSSTPGRGSVGKERSSGMSAQERGSVTKTERRTGTRRGSSCAYQGLQIGEMTAAAARFRAANGTLQMYDRMKQRKGPRTYEETKKLDAKRKKLLFDGRTMSPINMILRLDKLGQTALVSILYHPVTWIITAIYALVASLNRTGYLDGWWTSSSIDRSSFDGASFLIVFMIVFYGTPSANARTLDATTLLQCTSFCGVVCHSGVLLHTLRAHVRRPRAGDAKHHKLHCCGTVRTLPHLITPLTDRI